MRRLPGLLLVVLMLCTTAAFAAERGELVTVTFEIVDNEFGAISARVGMAFDPDVFEFVSAERISRDVLNAAPKAADDQYGLVNLGGISTGVLGTVTLRIRERAPAGVWEVAPVVDSVYDAGKRPVALNVRGETIQLDHVWEQGSAASAEALRCAVCGQSFRDTGSLAEGLPGDADGFLLLGGLFWLYNAYRMGKLKWKPAGPANPRIATLVIFIGIVLVTVLLVVVG